MAPSATAVKVFLDGETRRFPAGALPLHSLAELRARLSAEFPLAKGSNAEAYALRYTDEEGDVVTVRSQAEWEEALACLLSSSPAKVPRFTLARGTEKANEQQPASQAPLPPFLSFLDSVLSESQEAIAKLEPEESDADGAAPPVRLPFPFFGLPMHALFDQPATTATEQPEQASGAKGAAAPAFMRHRPCQRRPCGGAWRGPHRDFGAQRANCRAVQMMEARDYEGAAELLEKAAAEWPEHASTRYNLACTSSLTGDADAAMRSLALALELGFANKSLLATDPDLDPLRTRPDFVQLLDRALTRQADAADDAQSAPAPTAPPCMHPLFNKRGQHRPSLFCHRMPLPGQAPAAPEEAPLEEKAAQKATEVQPVIIAATGDGTAPPAFLMASHPFKEDPAAEVVVDVAVGEEEWSDSSCDDADDAPEAEAEEPFQYAREFAEVRQIGVPVPDTTLRSLLGEHSGDVGAVMAHLCTTPR